MPSTTEFTLPYPGDNDAADVPQDMNELATAVEAALNILIPAGSIVATVRTTTPTGWLLCQGGVVARATYARLFAIIGTTYNTGGETGTEFRLPDFRGRVIVGVDGSAGRLSANDALGNSGGVETVTLTAAQSGTASHTHTINDAGHDHDIRTEVVTGGIPFEAGNVASTSHVRPDGDDPGTATTSDTTGITVNAHAGASAASSHTNLQPYLTTNFIIRI